jgi:methyl-galactoside transport system substrate-binding protein
MQVLMKGMVINMGKIRHVIIYIILVVLLCGSMSGCGKNSDEKQVKSIKIGVTLYDQYDTFISQLMECFNEYAVKKETDTGIAINVEVFNASVSQSTQNSQVKTMIDDECDIICVNLVDRTDPTLVIDQAKKADIPVIFFNRELVEEDLERWDKLYYVGAPALESGIMEGELAAEVFKNDKSADKNNDGVLQYVILEGEASHQDAIVRTEYSVNTLVENDIEVEKLGYAIANWNRAQAQTKMAQMINLYGDKIEVILSNNDDMALGAIDALKAAKIDESSWPLIFGIDGTDVGLKAVKNKEMTASVYNDKKGQAEAMLNLLFEIVTGGDLSDLNMEDGKYIWLPYSKVTFDDVDKYMDE